MNIKSIAIEITDKAFLPESYAYRDYFRSQGFYSDLVEKGSDEAVNYDAIVLFHGFHPFWRKYPKFVIGEYNSLSTGKYNRLKDLIKRIVNVRPELYVFLNEDVRQKMWFSKRSNYVIRSMGYRKSGFEKCRFGMKEFDIVYCGSYRSGLLVHVQKLADLGFSIALVGFETEFKHEKVVVFGRMNIKEAHEKISQARFGLNYTPNVYPLNIQDSTKVIEYCAAGLGIITNKYKWVNEFEESRKAKFLDLYSIEKPEDVLGFNFSVPDVSDLEWEVVLKNTNFKKELE